jgi:hypothetical protein
MLLTEFQLFKSILETEGAKPRRQTGVKSTIYGA